MKQDFIKFLDNKNSTDAIEYGNLRLAPFSKIIDSRVSGNLFLGLSSCINRCDLGRYVGIAYFSYVADTHSGNYCTFGSRVSLGAFSHPTDSLTVHEVGYRNTIDSYGETTLLSDCADYLESRSARTEIGHDVWIGDNSVVIKGVKVGNGAIVAAGSVVTKDVLPYAIVGGNPAKVIRMRFAEDIVQEIQATGWWNLSMKELTGIPFRDLRRALKMLTDLGS
jgi:virginiamycin A acetyltransferase